MTISKSMDKEAARTRELSLMGMDVSDIANTLNREGFTTATGKKWNERLVRDFSRRVEKKPRVEEQTIVVQAKHDGAGYMSWTTPQPEDTLLREIVESNLSAESKLALIRKAVLS